MQIAITIDCTPEEARTFLGVPDFSAIQQQFAAQMQEKLRQQMTADPEAAMKAWFNPAAWQQMFKPE